MNRSRDFLVRISWGLALCVIAWLTADSWAQRPTAGEPNSLPYAG